ncbi:MAG: aminopeptidase P family protein [Lachnospiraceae bacterium]|nr:aminopeptidase P family protein [Lachnospiraceae bacterium]
MIRERITAIKSVLKDAGIDFYIVPTSDYHNSEYVNDYFKQREFLSGFTGSNGTLVISRDEVGLWTDGRYFVQAERELTGSGIVLYRMNEEGVPTIEEYLEKNMKEQQILGFDGRVVDTCFGKNLEKCLADKKISFVYDKDLVDTVWTDRPKLPVSKLWVIPEEKNGQTVEEKLTLVRGAMKKAKAAHLFISKLDDIMWLYNVRANDVECNPVALSYTFISENEAVFFVQKDALTPEAEAYFEKYHITVKDYHEVAAFLADCSLDGSVWCDCDEVSYLMYKRLSERVEIIDRRNPTTLMKAVKNATELKNIREYYLKDSVALTKFLFWMKQNAGKVEMDEYSVAMKLDSMRAKVEGFLDLSFPTISAFKENAAMMHYSATEDNKAEIAADGLYLVDSGGQYIGATTDVTRTIALGQITDEMKKHFSKVVCGMLRLADAKFLYGCTGKSVDILAREPLWECYIDYKCGTGHGIGYILNVHEAPPNIRWRYNPGTKEDILEAGMIVSDEPGVYIEGSHGIRIENILEIVNEEKNGDGQFMGFRHLTYVPIDLDAIDTRYMEPRDVERLNAYHEEVYRRLEPYFEGEEKLLLRESTRQLEY